MKYNKDTAARIFELLAEDSYTVKEICAAVGIVRSTFYKWQTDFPEFSDGINEARAKRRAKMEAVAENSLLRKIRGYTETETKTVQKVDAKGRIYTEQVTTTTYYPPDTSAIIFTLTNRDPEHWKNKQSADITSNGKTIAAADPIPPIMITRDALAIIKSGTLPPLPDDVQVVETEHQDE